MNYWNLITKHLTSEISLDEQRELQDWIDQSPENAELFEKTQKLWKLSGKYNFDFQTDKQRDWDELKAKILAESGDLQTRSDNALGGRWLRVAAAVLVIAGVSYFISTFQEQDTKLATVENSVAETVTYVELAAIDSVRVFYLPDSTQIWLNKNSTFSYPEKFIASERGVVLTGEAFFQVVADTAIPFIVYAGSTQTKVLGTSFNVRAYENEEEVEVVVAEGKVQFSSEDSKDVVILVVDERATYHREKRTYKRDKGNASEIKWWLKDVGEELEDAGEEIKDDVKRFFKRAKTGIDKKKNKRK